MEGSPRPDIFFNILGEVVIVKRWAYLPPNTFLGYLTFLDCRGRYIEVGSPQPLQQVFHFFLVGWLSQHWE